MVRIVVASGVWCICSGVSLAEVNLSYGIPPGTVVVTTSEGASEFSAVGNIPGFDKVEGNTKTLGKRRWRISAAEDGSRNVRLHITGQYETMITVNKSPWNKRVVQVGPLALLVAPQGEILAWTIPPFDAKLRNLMTFSWMDYLWQQLSSPEALPGRVVRVGETWTSEAKITSPTGDEIQMSTTSKLVGRSMGEQSGWWFYSNGVLPMDFRFETPVGTYVVDGEIRLHRMSLYDAKEMFVRERIFATTTSMDVALRRKDATSDARGQSFNMHMFDTAKIRFKAQIEPKEAEEKSRGASEAAP
jgi:hypothetical protein